MQQNLNSALNGKSILVTGSTGFVGRNLISFLSKTESFKQTNLRIVCSGRNSENLELVHPIGEGFEHFVWDINTRARKVPKSIDYVIHLAGEDRFLDSDLKRSRIMETSISGTANVLNLVDQVSAKKMLLASSGAVYAPREQPTNPFSEDEYSPSFNSSSADPYTVGKRTAERMCSDFSLIHGMNISIARLFTLIGPHFPIQRPFAIGDFVRMCLRNEPIVVRGSSNVVRSYQNVEDTSRWLLTILLSNHSDNLFNVGDDLPINIPDLARTVAAVCGNRHPIQFTHDKQREDVRNYYIPNIFKAQRNLGLKNNIPIEASIIEMYNSFSKISL